MKIIPRNRGSSDLFFESLLFDEFGVSEFLEGALLSSKMRQLLFLHDLQQRLLHVLADQHLQDRLDLDVKVEQIACGQKEMMINNTYTYTGT